MLKKILKVNLNVLLFFVLCVLQLCLFNNWYIFGTRFNMPVIFIIIISMLNPLKVSMPVAFLVGGVTDILFGQGLIKYLVVYMVVVIVLEGLKQLYKQDIGLSVALYTTSGLLVFEILTAIFSAINTGVTIGFFAYIFAVIKTIILNVPMAYAIHTVFTKINEKLEK